MESGPRPTLAAVAQTEMVVASVQRHFSSAVAPHLASGETPAMESAQALAQFKAVLERAVESALEAVLDGADGLLTRTLAAEQRRGDFLPTAAESGRIDRPTAACQLVVAAVKALKLDVEEWVRAEVAQTLLTEVRLAPSIVYARWCGPHMMQHQQKACSARVRALCPSELGYACHQAVRGRCLLPKRQRDKHAAV